MSVEKNPTEMREHLYEFMETLSLPEGHYVLIGSGVMQAAGLRYANDIDVLVSDRFLRFCTDIAKMKLDKPDYSRYDRAVYKSVLTMLPAGHPRGQRWPSRYNLKTYIGNAISDNIYPMDFDTALTRSANQEGLQMLTLHELMVWKKALVEAGRGRTFEQADIELIAAHLGEDN